MLKLKWRHFFGQFTSVHSSRDWDLDHLPRIFAFARGTLRSTATALNTPKMKQLLIASILLTLAACQGPTTTEPQEEPQGTSQTPTSLPGQGEDAGKTVIYRDTYDVPHIYAPTVEAGLYAQGWAQAEDRPTQLLLNLKIALGELTEIQGEEGVQTSLISHMFGHMRNATRSVANMSESELRRVRAFANGITDYYKAHPEDVPEWWRHEAITPAMIDAFGRMFLYNWSIDEAFTDLFHGGIEPDFITTQRASNQWAVSPSRTSDGHAILLIDPHLSWWGVSRFWEMRIHAGELKGSGVSLPGSPYIGLGHNADLAWAMATGGPDTADVYALELDPEDPNRYRYDDEWRSIEQHEVTLRFPDGSSQAYLWEASHHGPIIARKDGVAYAARIAYDSDTYRNRAWEALNFAEDYRGAVAACETLSMFPQNLMVADTSGNIYYQRTGRVPVRDLGYDWSQPVDGSTRDTEWQGFHPASNHLQMLNPESGYMQNCNIPPDTMIPDSPFRLDAQPGYLFSSAVFGTALGSWTNQRAARAIELLSQDSDVTVPEALAYAVDVQPFGYQRWLEALAMADAPASDELTEMLEWDGQITKDSTAALKYYYWLKALDEAEQSAWVRSLVQDYDSIVEQRPPWNIELNAELLAVIRETWLQGLDEMRSNHGDTAQPWGRVFRAGRDDVTWPVGGGGGDLLDLTTLRTMLYHEPNERHERHGVAGQTSTQVVVLSKPIQSWIYLPVGQSDRPESPHYRDQAGTVFSERTLRPSWWLPEDLAGHIESRVELQVRN